MIDRIKNMFKKKNDESENLTDIVRGIQHAVNSSIESVDRHYIKSLNQFFKYNKKDGTFEAKMATIKIDDNNVIKVPFVSLAHQLGMSLDKMKVKMSVEITNSTVKKHKNQPITRSSFGVKLAPHSSDTKRKGKCIDIEMEFKANDPPEGVARTVEYLTNSMQPKKK